MAGKPGSNASIAVLIVDSDATQRRLLAAHVDSHPMQRFSARVCADAGEAQRLATERSAIVIGDVDSLGGVRSVGALAATVPLIATSNEGSLHNAVAAMRAGAIDFVAKPVGARALLERLEQAVAEGLRQRPAKADVPAAPERPEPETDFAGFVGRSAAMRAVYDQIERIAASRAAVFITGESGTGKEVCAEAIHQRSEVRDRPFVAINCASIPRELMESELFGHVRGAFTGAVESRSGAAELADGGTLFLDEIGELHLDLQAKLLRFIQTGLVQRVGGDEPRQVDVRIISATNRDPQAAIERGQFREDLYYRLHVLPLSLPALRARGDDILLLARHFLARYAREEGRTFVDFEPDAADLLSRAEWPGNVRQLQNVIRRAVVLNDGVRVTAAMLPDDVRQTSEGGLTHQAPASGGGPLAPLWMHEQRIIESAMAVCGGNVARAAAALGISPSTIYRKRQSWPDRKSA